MATNPFDYAERFNRPRRAPEPSPVDPVAAEIKRMREDEVRSTFDLAPPPDQAARTTRLSREADVPPALVEGREDSVEKALQTRRFIDLTERYPAIGKFAVSNPRGAIAAQDDHESLGVLGTAWDFLKNLPGRAFRSGGFNLAKGINDAYTTLIEQPAQAAQAPIYAGFSALSQATGLEWLDPASHIKTQARISASRRAYFENKVTAAQQANAGGNAISEGLLQGVDSAGMTLAAIATRNPGMAASVLGTLTGSSSVQEARDKGLSVPAALRYGATQGAIEGGTELIPAGTLIEQLTKRLPFGKAVVKELWQEMLGEQTATVLQDMNDWASLPENRGKTVDDFIAERPGAAGQTALAVLGGVGTTTSAIATVNKATELGVKAARRVGEARQARAEAAFLDRAAKAVAASKLKARDPEALRALLKEQAQDAGASSVYIPAEAVRTYQQQDGYDQSLDPFADLDWSDAEVAGGDIVLPIEDALVDVVGTPAWEAVKDHARLTAGGMSKLDAETFDEAMTDLTAALSEDAAAQDRADNAARDTRTKLVDKVAALFGESFTSPAARKYAELAVQRAETRAARLGMPLTGNEFDGFDVRQVLPEGVAQAVKADNLDLVINAMRQGKDAQVGVGESLLAWLKDRGGINDTGGDLASLGLDKKLIREFDPSQGVFDGISGAGDYGLDTTLRDAIQAGFFPELRAEDITQVDTQILIDAIGQEVGGSPVYRETRTDPYREAGADLRNLLADVGLDPDTASDAEIRAAVARFEEAGNEGGQAYEQEARGRIIFDQQRRTIELFQARNLSTPIHELGHMWLEELRADASLPEAPEQLKGDWETVKEWFAANGHAISDNGMIPTAAHELWARGTERYVMEGKAPSPALTRIFETMRAWLVNVYKSVKALNSPITPEIREVFDRMLATDEEIAAAREEQMLTALFKDMPEGMSETEFAAYKAEVEGAKAEASSTLIDKTMRSIRRRTMKRYIDARKAIKAEETERIDGSPLFKALRLMKEQRVNQQWLEEEFGADVKDLLPVRVPPIWQHAGADPQMVAEMAGYATARDMIESIIGAEKAHREAREGGDPRSMRGRAIESATDIEFERRFGDPFNDGSIEREALAAIHNDRQGEVLASELRILSRTNGKKPTPYRVARAWARGKVRQGMVADEAMPAAIDRYRKNAAKAGRAAEAAIIAKDSDEAFRQKQFQMLNSALLAEAKAAYDEVEAAVTRMAKIAKARTRKSIDQDYLEQAQALLENVDLKPRSQKGIDRQGSWEAWAAEREAEGFDLVTPPSFEATLGKTNWSRLSVENLLALDEQVKQIIHLGRLKRTMLDNQEQREFEAIVAEVEAGADGIGRKPPKGSFTEPGWFDSIRARVATMDAALLKMEQVFDWLDQGKSNGVFNRIVFRPLADAQGREQDMTRDYYGRIREAMKAVPKETIARWNDKVAVGLMDPGNGAFEPMPRHKLIAMALNWGNAGNRQRLIDGNYERIREVFGTDAAINSGWNADGIERALTENLTAEEWQFVQNVWDIIDTLWPDIAKMERAINGVAPDKVEPVEVVTPHGTFRGGYYPAVYDASLDYKAEEQAGRRSDMFEANYVRATTRASATKDRAEKVKRPILLDLGVINRHLGEVIHDITHREAVMRANKFLTDRRVMKAVDETLGVEVRKQFRPWLKHIANSWASERAGNEGLGKFLTKLRANATVVGMGWRVTTILTQVAGYSNSFEYVGARWVIPAIAASTAHPIDTWRFVAERSDEMRNRMDNIDRDIRLAINQMAGKYGALSAAKRFAFHGIGYMDRAVSVPTWMGAYNKAIAEGMSEADAAYAADKAIRLSQGAGGPKDLAAVATGQGRYGEAFKLLTMFYSYLSTVYSRQRNLGRDAKRGGIKIAPSIAARAFWLIMVPPVLAEILSGRGPDDDEDWSIWAMQRMLMQSLGAIPMVRDAEPVLDALMGKRPFAYRLSPIQGAVEAAVRTGGDINKIAKGEETKQATRDVLETAGYFTGLVPGQVAAATQFMVDVGQGDADPDGVEDWYTGLTKGKLPED